MGGIMSLTGWSDAPPARIGTRSGDLSTALFASTGIVSSRRKRTRRRRPRPKETSHVQAAASGFGR
jgi:crotonobetainyl-CoA:carnitine CoA-transferase CaiB-like acyl-CoA transferase